MNHDSLFFCFEDEASIQKLISEAEKILSSEEKFSILKGTNEEIDKEDTKEKIKKKLRSLLANLEKKNLLYDAISFLLVSEVKEAIKSSSTKSLFRNISPGIFLFNRLWFLKESKSFFELVLNPFLNEICKIEESLELNPNVVEKGISVKKNSKIVSNLVERFFELLSLRKASEIFSDPFLQILRRVDREVCIFNSDFSYVTTGSLLFLRLLCPAILNPETHDLIDFDKISSIKAKKSEIEHSKEEKQEENIQKLNPHQKRNLILIAKILQNIGSGILFDGQKEKYMCSVNFFVKKYVDWWKKYVNYLTISDSNLKFNYENVQITIDEGAASDIILLSNQNLTEELLKEKPYLIEKQLEIVSTVLAVEKLAESWKFQQQSRLKVFWHREKGSSLWTKGSLETKGKVKDVYEFFVENYDNITAYQRVDRYMTDRKVLFSYNENLEIVQLKYALPMLDDRDFIILAYRDFIPSANFGLVAVFSVDDSIIKVQKTKKCIRGETKAGWIFRQKDEETVLVSLCANVDGKGMLSFVPDKILEAKTTTIC